MSSLSVSGPEQSWRGKRIDLGEQPCTPEPLVLTVASFDPDLDVYKNLRRLQGTSKVAIQHAAGKLLVSCLPNQMNKLADVKAWEDQSVYSQSDLSRRS